MDQVIKHHFHAWGYQAFKYLVYSALAFNVYLFFREEWLASDVVFANGVSLATFIEAYSSTIDTASWLVLLLLFELETYVIDDSKLVGATKWTIHTVRGLCYVIILYALYGYLTKVGLLSQFLPTQVTDLCTLTKDWRYMETLNVYNTFTSESCKTLSSPETQYFVHENYKVIVSLQSLNDVKMLAWVDVINSAAWVSVVMMLEFDVHIQLGNVKSALWSRYNKWVKATVYSVILVCAIYWGVTGNFVEFWDAFLWIVAFVLIEMNMFEWQKEVAERNANVRGNNTHN